MRWVKDRYRELASLLRRDHVDHDVAEEFAHHLALLTEENIAAGMTPEQARAAAVRRFGDVDRLRQETHDMEQAAERTHQRTELLGLLRQEGRRAVRALARAPAFTGAIILTLALGIAATTTVFTLLDAIVLRPLPYPDADRLVRLRSAWPGFGKDTHFGLARAQFLYFQQNTTSFEALGLYLLTDVTLDANGRTGQQAERATIALVNAGLMQVLRGRPLLGRGLTADDNLSATPTVALITHDFWRKRFASDSQVIGSTVTFDGRPVEIIGVLAPGTALPEEVASADRPVALWAPMQLDPGQPADDRHSFKSIGRLRRGAALTGARAELAQLTARLPAALPAVYSEEGLRRTGLIIEALPLRDDVVGDVARLLWILMGAVGLVFTIACANVANLFLVRLQARRRELAIRRALGAAPWQLAVHFLMESMLLMLLAGGLGVFLSYAGIQMLVATTAFGLPRLADVHLGWSGLVFAVLVAGSTGLVFGLIPLARGGTGNDVETLREGGRGLTASRRQRALRHALVVAQVALSVVLLAGAFLLLESFRQLRRVRPGVDPHGVLTFQVQLPKARYDSEESVATFYRSLTERLAPLPGVETVGLIARLPLDGEFFGCAGFAVEGQLGADDTPRCVPIIPVTPGLFRALGIPVRGRPLEWTDLERQAPVVVVSEALAQQLWPGQDPVGRRITRIAYDTTSRRIIGVAGDVRANGLSQPPIAAVYLPVLPVPVGPAGTYAGMPAGLGEPARSMAVAVRTRAGNPDGLVPIVRRTLAELDSQVSVDQFRSMGEIVANSTARVSFTALLLGLASGMAVLLSAIGLYGVVAYVVGEQRAEIGIRMALGARAAVIARAVVLQALRLAGLGILVGIASAVVATSVLRSLLFGVTPGDPRTLAAVAVLLALIAMAAGAIPARRAARVEPVEAMR